MASFTIEMGTELLKSGRFSDYTIHVESTSFKVHRVVLAPVAEYFKSITGYQDGDWKEAIEQEATIGETSALAFAKLLYWVYTDSFDFNLEEIYEIWPDFRPSGHVIYSQHLDAVADAGNATKADEVNYNYYRTVHDSVVSNITASIRLYELADRFGMLRLRDKTEHYILEVLHISLRDYERPGYADSQDILEPEEIAEALEFIYQYDSGHWPLRTEAMVRCIQWKSRIAPRGVPPGAVLATILNNPKMSYDWNLGLKVLEMVSMREKEK